MDCTRNHISISTMGRFQLAVDGRIVRINQNKQKALIAYVCTQAERVFSREQLADLLWRRSSTANGKHSLSQALYAIRRLVPDLMEVDEAGVAANKDIAIDVRDILCCSNAEVLLKRLPSIQGPFLANLSFDHSPEYENWRSSVSRRVFAHIDAALARHLLELNSKDLSVPALSDIGHVLEFCPRIEAAIQETEKANKISRDIMEGCSRATPIEQPSLGVPLVARKAQLQSLAHLWTRARAREPQCVVIHGPPGHGKTKLMDHFLNEVEEPFRLLKVRCYPAERRVGLAPVVDLLERNITTEDLVGLADVWVDALAQIAPTLQRGVGLQTPPALSDSAAQTRLFESVLRTLEHVGSVSPAIVFIDDAQWADKSSKALLSYLSHRLRRAAILIAACVRTREGRLPSAPWLDWQHLKVAAFADEEIAELLQKAAQSMPLDKIPSAEALKEVTGGIPYFTAEAIRACAAGAGLREWTRTHIRSGAHKTLNSTFRGLDPRAERILSLLAALGRPADARLIKRLARIGDVTKPLDTLKARGIIVVHKGKLSLVHDLVRAAAYSKIPMFMRADIHRRIAEVLREKHAGEAAEHYFKAGSRQLAQRYALQAVQEADDHFANDASISFLKLAIKARRATSYRHRWTLAQKLFRAHRLLEAKVEIDQLLLAPRVPVEMNRAAMEAFNLELAHELCQITPAKLHERFIACRPQVAADDHQTLIRLLRLRARAAYHAGDLEKLPQAIRELRAIGVSNMTDDGVDAIVFAARVHSAVYSSEVAMKWIEPILDRIDLIVDPERHIEVVTHLSGIAYEAGDLARALDLQGKILKEIDRTGAVSKWPIAAANAHMYAVERGNFALARELSQQLRDRSRELTYQHQLVAVYANDAVMFHHEGEHEHAYETAEKAQAFFAPGLSVWVRVGLAGVRGTLALNLGKVGTAQKLAREAQAILDNLGCRAGDVSWAEILICRLLVLDGRRQEARSRLADAISSYRARDPISRMRLELELAWLSKDDRNRARDMIKSVFDEARRCGAQPIAERADSFLHRL